MAGYTVFRELDRDGDGWWEERWDLAAGAVVRWTRDADQDGVSEFDALLDAGRPVSLSFETSESSRSTLVYGVYPWVSRVVDSGPAASGTGRSRTGRSAPRSSGKAAPACRHRTRSSGRRSGSRSRQRPEPVPAASR